MASTRERDVNTAAICMPSVVLVVVCAPLVVVLGGFAELLELGFKRSERRSPAFPPLVVPDVDPVFDGIFQKKKTPCITMKRFVAVFKKKV